ncbi:MAG: nucleotidyl transferase AbiEii/AbiGii toxin family protein [Candidatus Cloacimonetes bacterium]|nr:nucleotidyl transferase AbiEii/AbiGii toxin family protein [Candidatus Cloacimonadota bacterium]
MFEQVLPGNTKAVLALLEKSEIIKKAYLAGWTALALQLGHRISYDLDFFTKEGFDEQLLLPHIEKISKFELEQIAWRTILGKFDDVRFSIFYYEYPILYQPKKLGKINILDIPNITAMKIAAISSRGTKRDFIDLFFICKGNISVKEALLLYEEKYKNLDTTAIYIMKSLIFFDDAEDQEMPHMLKELQWQKVKMFFETEVRKLEKSFFGII